MQTGFEVTAAVPKRLRAAEDAPAHQPMRGERRITQAPSTDQKKVRRAMQRKTAANITAGDCRLCGGDLIPQGYQGETLRAQCAGCGTKHQLQNASVKPKSAALAFQTFQNLSVEARARIEMLAHFEQAAKDPCPNCGDTTWGMRNPYGLADSSDEGLRTMVHCKACDHFYTHRDPADHPVAAEHGRTAASHTSTLLRLIEARWDVVVDTNPYLSQNGMSAIARRAQSVLDTEENS